MKIGLVRETKNPVDNRVALSPKQVAKLNKMYPQSEIIVQSSNIRAYSDDDYRKLGIKVVDDLKDCDVLFGIKEAKIDTILPCKHYFFFGHIAKMQAYNKPLLLAFMNKKVTFSDYEYLVDSENERLCAFGWWAGVVGLYYTLQGYGYRTKSYNLPKPDLKFTLKDLKEALCKIELPNIKLLITGNGRVSQGAQYILKEIGATELTEENFLNDSDPVEFSYYVAKAENLLVRKDGNHYVKDDFKAHPDKYKSNFMKYGKFADVLLSCHFWDPKAPVYLNKADLKSQELRIKFIGDVTCDIQGSIKSTIRASTHSNPFYDYNPISEKEEIAFSSLKNISVMAVDTCPNALALDASNYFGEMLISNVFIPLLENTYKNNKVINGATILVDGQLTEPFSYLTEFAKL